MIISDCCLQDIAGVPWRSKTNGTPESSIYGQYIAGVPCSRDLSNTPSFPVTTRILESMIFYL